MKKLTLVLLFFWTIAFAQDEILVYADKYALVIGANDYEYQNDLSGIPINDAVDMKNELESLGFLVTFVKNPNTKRDLNEAIRDFAISIKNKKGMALFYYSGHGVQAKGESYLLPTGIDIKMESDIEHDAYPVSRIIDLLNETSNPVKFVLLDACRTVVFKGHKSGTSAIEGLTKLDDIPEGVFIGYAAVGGAPAIAVSYNKRNSPYTQAILDNLRQPIKVQDIFLNVRNSVFKMTDKKQRPEASDSLIGQVYLKKPNGNFTEKKTIKPETKKEEVIKEEIIKEDIEPRRKTSNDPKLFVNSIRMEFVFIPPGEFMMGCSKDDRDCQENDPSDEKPAHKVKITKSFFMGKYEVTQKDWKAVMKTNPSDFKSCGLDCPVENITWKEAKTFIDKLNSLDNNGKYRLPTEAEWEYAARGGETTKYYWGSQWDDSYAWCSNMKKSNMPTVVGQKKPNLFGLHDMLGNVYEMCEDKYQLAYYKTSPQVDPQGPRIGDLEDSGQNIRVVRGGAFDTNKPDCSVSARGSMNMNGGNNTIGIRLVYFPNKTK
jgi:formylglycine-generating enzyme required for sulfatase activity